jgi:uncharacterized protein (TIGR00661 family)
MANILYGVNGEGSGHSTRAKEVLTHLERRGHTLHVASFDRGLRNLSATFAVEEIYGFRFAFVNNQVKYKRTLARNLVTAPQAAHSIKHLSQLVEEWKIDAVITDFEPLTSHVGHHKGLPVISIDNQHSLTNTRVSYPRKYARDAAAAKLVTRLMTPRADAYLVTSFFDAPVKKAGTFMFPPIVRQEVLNCPPASGEHVLVYVTSPSVDMVRLLSRVRCRFIAYGFDREGEQGNILFKKPSMTEFLADLAGCKAVVANAGFSLVSEALHLRKPYLAVPVRHQFEQIFNAYYLDKMGYGTYREKLDKEKVESFLANLPIYGKALDKYPRQDNAALLAKLDQLISGFTSANRTAAKPE